jgi:hypothetical protein
MAGIMGHVVGLLGGEAGAVEDNEPQQGGAQGGPQTSEANGLRKLTK